MKKLIVSLLFVPAVASAEFVNGNELLSNLQSNDATKRVFALGYIAGVFDAHHSVSHCPSAGVSLGQVRDMTEQYLIVNASSRNLSADLLISDMLKRRWPCSNQSSGRGA